MKIYHSTAPYLSKLLSNRLIKNKTIEIIKNKNQFLEKEITKLISEFIDLCAAAKGRKNDDSDILQKLAELKQTISSFSPDEVWEIYVDKIGECLLDSDNVDDVFASDEDLAAEIRKYTREFLDIVEKAEEKAKSKIRNITESSPAFASELSKRLKQELANQFKMI